ncbi:hypothetical protein Ancab_030606 [Ancistrocladus abbreviatus]
MEEEEEEEEEEEILYQEKKGKRKVIMKLEQTVSKRTRNFHHGSSSSSFCDICVDGVKSNNELFTIQSCTHSFCKNCIKKYVAAYLMECRYVTAKYIKCPYLSCQGVLEPPDCVDVVPQELLDRWETALCEGLLLANYKNYFSPYIDGQSLIVYHGKEVVVMVQCPFCRRMFRAQSRIAWHGGITDCKKYKIRSNGVKDYWERTLESIVAWKTKWCICPNCCYFLARVDHDNYMLCRCGHESCYSCSEEWNQNHKCYIEVLTHHECENLLAFARGSNSFLPLAQEEETSSTLEEVQELEFWTDMKLLFQPPTLPSPSINMDASMEKREVTADEIQAVELFMSELKDKKLSELIEGGNMEHLEHCLKVITLARNPPAHLAKPANELSPQLPELVNRLHVAKSSLSESERAIDAQKARFVAVGIAIQEWETLVEKERIIAEDLTATEATVQSLMAEVEMEKERLNLLRAQKKQLMVYGTKLKKAIQANLHVEQSAKFNKKEAEVRLDRVEQEWSEIIGKFIVPSEVRDRKFEASPASHAPTTLSLSSAQVLASANF